MLVQHTNTSKAAKDGDVSTCLAYSSHGNLHASDVNLDKQPVSASRQSMRAGTCSVTSHSPATGLPYSSRGELHASDVNLKQPLTASRQSMRVSTYSVANEDELATGHAYSSRGDLHVSNANLSCKPLAASRQSFRSSYDAANEDFAIGHAYSYQEDLHASDKNLSNQPFGASHHSLRVNTCNVVGEGDLATGHAYSSRGDLHASDADLSNKPTEASRQSLRASTYSVTNEGDLATGRAYSSRGDLHASDADLSNKPLPPSRQDLRTSAYDIMREEALTGRVYSQGNLHYVMGDVNLKNQPITRPRQSLLASANEGASGNEVAMAQTHSCQEDLQASDVSLNRQPLAASRQSIRSSSLSVGKEDELATAVYPSHTDVDTSDAHFGQKALSSCRRKLFQRSNSVEIADEAEPITVRESSSVASLRPSDANVSISTSRQNLHTGIYHGVSGDDLVTAQTYSSRGSLCAPDSSPSKNPLAASHQSIRVSNCNIASEDDLYTAKKCSPRGEVSASGNNLVLHRPLEVSYQDLHRSDVELAKKGDLATAASSSRASLQSSDVNLRLKKLSSSQRSSSVSAASDHGPPSARASFGSHLHVPLQSPVASQQNVYFDEDELATAQKHSSRSSLHASKNDMTAQLHTAAEERHLSARSVANSLRTAEMNSREDLYAPENHFTEEPFAASVRSSSLDVGNEGKLADAVHSSRASLCDASSNQQPIHSSSRLNLRSNSVDVVAEAALRSSSHASFHVPENVCHQPLAASRQSMRSNAVGIPKEAETEPTPKSLSRASLHSSNENASHQPLATVCASGDNLRYQPVRVRSNTLSTAREGSSFDCQRESFRSSEAILSQIRQEIHEETISTIGRNLEMHVLATCSGRLLNLEMHVWRRVLHVY
ncbi:unnamed protein product [Heligmosomoides polygyrus]|uniref:Uncharacterized protein n=1 Tax=Heligmosomoides polygyrus TaxID=6339 RepID=A0A3P8G221_HELPZ|nr:unnamed protein product [Heligmosomoides polygyrus]